MIKQEVLNGHLVRFPEEMATITVIEADFDVTWASRVQAFNTELSIYFLKPLPHISQAFGFDQELLLAVSSFPIPQARAIQVIEQTFEKLPAKGRVDQTVALLVSRADNIDVWIEDYVARNPQARAYVGLAERALCEGNDSWFLRNALVNQLFSRDLFEYTLPLNEDLFFFGRQAIVAEHIDAVRKSENRGLFGLRKTGKTSVLFKINRQCKAAGMFAIYYDCKLSSIYNLRGDELISQICLDIEQEIKARINGWRSKRLAADKFLTLVKNLPSDLRLCLIFDEIEYISAESLTADHWKTDFVPFWQTIWSSQSQHRKFCFIISGVNASIVEIDRIAKIQNPLFGIVKPRYLTGFERGEVHSLLNTFGKRMGLRFEGTAVDTLFHRYGGHPLLTRMICSQINTEVKIYKAKRPVTIALSDVQRDMSNRENEIQFYCGHITSELQDFYPEEYEILELLATGNVVDFNDFAAEIDMVRHLKSYGLVDFSVPSMPKFAIPVIKNYIASHWRKRNGLKSDRYVVPQSRRNEYVNGRVASILRDLRLSDRRFSELKMPPLYKGAGPEEAEYFALLKPVNTRDDVAAFLNQCSRSLIEPIDETGSALNKNKYFFSDLPNAYPRLWPSLNRIRAYRNYIMHIKLNEAAKTHLENLLREDFEGTLPDTIEDGWFRLQAAVLDGLVIGIQAELANYD